MKTIIWNGPERELPGCGLAVKGAIMRVPEHAAKSYVYQGLADYYKEPAMVACDEEAKPVKKEKS